MQLPLFPLHTVLFPGRPLSLHVFEQRYRQMLTDCLEGDRWFGVVAIRHGHEVGDTPEVFEVGTVAEIESVTTLGDGRSDICTRGLQRFRIERFLDGTPYLRAKVTPLDDTPPGPDDKVLADQVRELLIPYLSALGAPVELLDSLPQEPDRLAYLAAAAVQVDVREQQRLLELDHALDRLEATLAMLRREKRLVQHLGVCGSLRPPGPNGADLN